MGFPFQCTGRGKRTKECRSESHANDTSVSTQRSAKTKEKPVGVNRRALSLSHERLLQRGVDRGELGVQVGAEAVDHSDDREGDAGSNQSIFDGGSASLVLQEADKKLGHKGESPG